MNPIARMMKRYIKTPLRYALPLLFIGALVLASTTGCLSYKNPPGDVRQYTTLTATWQFSKPTSVPVTSAGLTVSGKLTSTSSGAPLAGKSVELWYADEGGQATYLKASSPTDQYGNYKITLSSSEDTHYVYGTVFTGSGDPNDKSGWSGCGYNAALSIKGLVGEIDKKKIEIRAGSSSWIPGTASATITVLSAAELQLKYGRYSDAANTIQTKLLPHFAKVANPPTTGTNYWIKDHDGQVEAYNTAADAIGASRLMCGQVTSYCISNAEPVYVGAVIPHIE